MSRIIEITLFLAPFVGFAAWRMLFPSPTPPLWLVHRLRPILTRRTQVARVNRERMRANAIEAAEQCGVLHVPIIEEEQSLEKALTAWEPGRLLVLCDEDAPIADPVAALRAAPPASRHALLIGPEGGFDPQERERLLAHPFVLRLSIGPRILRADTAAVAAMALLQAARGDWRTSASAGHDVATKDLSN